MNEQVRLTTAKRDWACMGLGGFAAAAGTPAEGTCWEAGCLGCQWDSWLASICKQHSSHVTDWPH